MKSTLKHFLRQKNTKALWIFLLKVSIFFRSPLTRFRKLPTRLWNQYRTAKHYHAHYRNYYICYLEPTAIGVMLHCIELDFRKLYFHLIDPLKEVCLICPDPQNVPNKQFLELIKKHINVVYDETFHNALTKGGRDYLIRKKILLSEQYADDVVKKEIGPNRLTFNDEETQKGRLLLKKIGLDIEQPFIVVHHKTHHYYQQKNRFKSWDDFRNSEFDPLLPSIRFLKDKGIPSVRLGSYENLDSTEYLSINILTEEEREFMDFFLFKHCLFTICGNSGLLNLPWFARTPTLIHNYIPMGDYHQGHDQTLFMFKLLKRKATGQILSIKEILAEKSYRFSTLDGDIGVSIRGDQFRDQYEYDMNEFLVIDNSAEDILEGTKLMLQMVTKGLSLTEEQQKRQTQFRQAFPMKHVCYKTPGLICPSFLDQYYNQLLP